ncbi:MAG TPA: hypothetical protein VGN88_05045 [Phycisphaerae bacterium]
MRDFGEAILGRFWPLLGAEKPLNGRVLTSLGAKKPLGIDFQFLIFNFQFSKSRGREKVVLDEGHGASPFYFYWPGCEGLYFDT